MPQLETPETLEQWTARHGDYVVIPPSVYLFRDGARMQYSDVNRGHTFTEPSENPSERLRAVHRYFVVKVKQAERAFNNLQSAQLDQERLHAQSPMNCPPSDADAPAVLAKMRDDILKLRSELAHLDREIEAMPETIARREFEEGQRQRAAASRERTAALLAISINSAPPQEPEPVQQVRDGYALANKVLDVMTSKWSDETAGKSVKGRR